MPANAAILPVDAIAQGHHVCGVSASEPEHEELLAEFVAAGITRGERVWCLPDAAGPDDVLDALAGAGIAVRDALERGHLAVVPASDSYLSDLPFDPGAMVAALHGLVDDALAAGYRGLRVAGDMSWATRGVPGGDRLEEYEAAVDEVLATRPAAALCQYDRRRFDPARLDALTSLHGHTARVPSVSGNGSLRVHRLAGAGSAPGIWLRIAGDADVASAEVLAAALAEARAGDGDVHLDLARLRYMDLAGLRPLAELVHALGPERRLVLHHPAACVQRLVELLDGYVARTQVVA